MRKLFVLFLFFIVGFMVSSCNLFDNDSYPESGEIIKLKEEGRYIEVSYENISSMLQNKQTFVLFLKSSECYQCFLLQDEFAEILNDDENKKLYVLNTKDLKQEEKDELIRLSFNLLGQTFYDKNELNNTKLYAPISFQIKNGEYQNAILGFKSSKKLKYIYDFNYFSLPFYDNVLQKINSKDKLDIYYSYVVGTDNIYDEYLRTYFTENPDKEGYYFNYASLKDEEVNKLLNEINFLFNDESKLITLPVFFKLTYVDNKIQSYEVLKTPNEENYTPTPLNKEFF